MKKHFLRFLVILSFVSSCKRNDENIFRAQNPAIQTEGSDISEKQKNISDAAISIIDPTIVYDPTYFRIPYPNGDVPPDRGVCTDVVIRTYRKLGIDLQELVHEDMKANFSVYPKIWGLTKPDPNIDHRRVPNLMKFFSRYGKELEISNNPEDYVPGDIIAWRLPNGMTHIGMMVDIKSPDKQRFQIVHNIGYGQILEDVLFDYEIIGHYRFEEF